MASGVSNRRVASRYDFSEAAIRRHQKHIAGQEAASQKAEQKRTRSSRIRNRKTCYCGRLQDRGSESAQKANTFRALFPNGKSVNAGDKTSIKAVNKKLLTAILLYDAFRHTRWDRQTQLGTMIDCIVLKVHGLCNETLPRKNQVQ